MAIGSSSGYSTLTVGKVRPGIALTPYQQLVEFVYLAQDLQAVTPFVPWAFGPIAHGGTATVNHATVMTDGAAAFTANALVGMVIHNITDRSSGTVIANTANTVTVAALAGGTLNTWTIGDAYVFSVHLVNLSTGIPMPYLVPARYFISIIEQRINFSQDWEGAIWIDGLYIAQFGAASNGSMISQSNIVAFGTDLLDPLCLTAHLPDLRIINRGGADMVGGITITCILELLH